MNKEGIKTTCSLENPRNDLTLLEDALERPHQWGPGGSERSVGKRAHQPKSVLAPTLHQLFELVQAIRFEEIVDIGSPEFHTLVREKLIDRCNRISLHHGMPLTLELLLGA